MGIQSFANQSQLATYVRERLAHQMKRAGTLALGVDQRTLTQPRADGGWSPAAVLDHLAIMNRLYIPKLDQAIVSAEASPNRGWRPTVGGRLIRWSVTTSIKVKTPALFKPKDPNSDAGSLDRFLRSHEELLDALERSTPLHWQSVHLTSPASSFIKLNLGDVFIVLANHGDRHLNQIEATLAESAR